MHNLDDEQELRKYNCYLSKLTKHSSDLENKMSENNDEVEFIDQNDENTCTDTYSDEINALDEMIIKVRKILRSLEARSNAMKEKYKKLPEKDAPKPAEVDMNQLLSSSGLLVTNKTVNLKFVLFSTKKN